MQTKTLADAFREKKQQVEEKEGRRNTISTDEEPKKYAGGRTKEQILA